VTLKDLSKCDNTDWQRAFFGGAWTTWRDTNDDVGGADPRVGHACVPPPDQRAAPAPWSPADGCYGYGCAGFNGDGADGDAYETEKPAPDELSEEGWCRINGDIFELAVRREWVELPDGAAVHVRPWSAQESSINPDQGLHFHDMLACDQAGSKRRDNMDWPDNITPVTLTAFAATARPGIQFTVAVAVVALLAAGIAVLVLLPRRRRSRSG
jgi:hypothetical protein